MKPLFKFLVGLLKGVAETTLIPSVVREVKKLTTGGAKQWLDVNGDGKVTFADIEALKWETIGKLIAVVVILYAAAHFGLELPI